MKLYELTKELQQLCDQLTGNNETLLPDDEIRARLDQFGAQFEYKAEQIGKMIRNFKAESEALKTESEHLARRSKALENHVKSLSNYLLINMENLGLQSVKGDILNITVRLNPQSVTITDIMQIPVEYMRIVPEQREPDKAKILANFNDTGELIPGTEINRSKRIEVK